MKKLIVLTSLFILSISVGCQSKPDEVSAFIASTHWVEKFVPASYGELDFPFADYRFDDIKNNSYIIESYFDCNVGKVEYRAKMKYKGEGSTSDYTNWTMEDFQILE